MATSTLDEGELRAWLRFIRDTRWNRAQKRTLLQRFKCPSALYALPLEDQAQYVSVANKNKRQGGIEKQVEEDIAWLQSDAAHSLLHLHHPDYPEMLNYIPDSPLALFCKGKVSVLNKAVISIVGSRRPSEVGLKLCEKISADLRQAGVMVCSGMALGIDAQAHWAALRGNGQCIAVLGCGVDVVYPARHRQLYEAISENGVVLSEYPPKTAATRYTFPSRNRIISGLAYGVVIIEAAEKSGTLITANCALEQSREVFVVPGSPLNPQYRGSHKLIQEGAVLIQSASDILLQLPTQKNAQQEIVDKTPAPQHETSVFEEAHLGKILNAVSFDGNSVDDIISRTKLSSSIVSSALLVLEMEEYVALRTNGEYFRLK